MASSSRASLILALLFLAAFHSAETCTCAAVHLQRDFCKSNVLVKGTFINTTHHDYGNSIWPFYEGQSSYTAYEIQIQEVFKGPSGIQDLKFISYMYLCPVITAIEFHIEYVITGNIESDRVVLGLCNYIKPWNKLSATQLEGLQGVYSNGCSCEIIDSYLMHYYDNTSNICPFDDYRPKGKDQDKNQMCVPNEEGQCTWETIASHLKPTDMVL